jgi:hypothetical protein
LSVISVITTQPNCVASGAARERVLAGRTGEVRARGFERAVKLPPVPPSRQLNSNHKGEKLFRTVGMQVRSRACPPRYQTPTETAQAA